MVVVVAAAVEGGASISILSTMINPTIQIEQTVITVCSLKIGVIASELPEALGNTDNLFEN